MNLNTAILTLALAFALAAHAQQPDIKQKPIVQTKPLTGSHPEFIADRSEGFLPDAPGPQPPGRASFWSFGDWNDARPLRTNHEVFHDKTWLITQGAWLGGIAYDVELTHQGLAHHKCVEENLDLGPRPSRGELYRSDIPEYALGTVFNWAMLKFVTKPLIFEFPSVAAAKHIQGGSRWLMDCW